MQVLRYRINFINYNNAYYTINYFVFLILVSSIVYIHKLMHSYKVPVIYRYTSGRYNTGIVLICWTGRTHVLEHGFLSRPTCKYILLAVIH